VLLYFAFLKTKTVNGRKEHVRGIRRIQKGMNSHSRDSKCTNKGQRRTGKGIK
jgi:hypothetical protein